MKCSNCDEQLEDISFTGPSEVIFVLLSHKEKATLYVCTNRDCSNCGVVLAIPWEAKD